MASPTLHRAVRTVRAIRAAVARPPYVASGHFYSPLTTDGDTGRAAAWAKEAGSQLAGIDLRETRQLALAAELSQYLNEPLLARGTRPPILSSGLRMRSYIAQC